MQEGEITNKKGFTLVELLISLSIITIILIIVSLIFVSTLSSDKTFSIEHEKTIAYYGLTKVLKNYITYLNTDELSTTTFNGNIVFYYKEVIPSLETIELYHWLYPYNNGNTVEFYSTITSVNTTPTDDIGKWEKIVIPLRTNIVSFSATPVENRNLRYQAIISLKNAIAYIDLNSATLTVGGIAYPPLK
ncbi:MAG: hypothetical protein PWQ20_1589 [Thermotogaceae bacterium]|nr:hypothetical protein [Thermotogaceae bacterium]MDN5338519.1 hypothetical protein [Thermotogaceae bacterium]